MYCPPIYWPIDWVKTYVYAGITFAPARTQPSKHGWLQPGDFVILHPMSPFAAYNDPANLPNQVGSVQAIADGAVEVYWLKEKVVNYYPDQAHDLVRVEQIRGVGDSLPDTYVFE